MLAEVGAGPADDAARGPRTRLLKRNLVLIPIVRALNMCIIGQGVLNLFWEHTIGLDVQQMFYLQVLNSIALSVMEVPSGYLSDTWGRRNTLCLAAACKTISFGVYGVASSWLHCCVAELFLAGGYACWSGTANSILYETQAELGQRDQALNRESYAIFVSQGTEALAAIAGGLVASYVSLQAAVLVTVLPYALCFVLCVLLMEPQEGPKQAQEDDTLGFMGRLRATFARREVTQCMYPSLWLGASTYLAVWVHQLLYERNGLPLPLFGVAWGALNMAVAVASLLSPFFHRQFGLYRTQFGLGLWGMGCWMVMGWWWSPWAVIAGCALNLQRGINGPMFTTHLNHLLTTEQRATIQSCYSLLFRLLFCLLAVGVGWIAKSASLGTACITAGAVTGSAVSLTALYLLRCSSTSPSESTDGGLLTDEQPAPEAASEEEMGAVPTPSP
uniref:Major facilitator superfamily (MFS) profile domain-containing protein n=1 Tax=Eutreptiella gymnastica TaxID=73025 RepID=A0A7S1ISZ9_9EUGL